VVEFSINKSDGVTTVSHSLKNDTLQSFKISNDIDVIHNFINLERFLKIDKPHFRKLVAQDHERILIHISNFRKVKRAEDVILMFNLLSKEIPSKLLMVGDGPERQKCEELCRELKICEAVKFLGKQEAVEELFAISDLMILPSESESFGLAALEAMACHVPVLASDAGGLPELIENGINGYMCPVGDVASMALYAKKILARDESLSLFKKQAYQTAQKFDIKIILPQYEALYNKILAQSKS
jgi:N-acetyl-alpha-D-glucosaminyl L-malate synthase BshA